MNASALLIGFAAGTLATFVAAQLPGAARLEGRAARRAAAERRGGEPGSVARRVLVGVGILVGGCRRARSIGATTGAFLPAGLGGLALVVGALLVAPVLVPPISRVLGGVLRRTRGVSGMLAEENARRNPRRSAATATALVIGVTVVSLFTLFTASLGATLDEQVRSGDHVGPGREHAVVRRRPPQPRRGPPARRSPGGPSRRSAWAAARSGSTARPRTVVAADVAALPDVMSVETVAGSLASVGADEIAVSRDHADDEHWKVGTPVTMTFARWQHGAGHRRRDLRRRGPARRDRRAGRALERAHGAADERRGADRTPRRA